MARRLNIRRMHFNADGRPKQRLNPDQAAVARKRGKHTYLCPICGKTHAGRKDNGG